MDIAQLTSKEIEILSLGTYKQMAEITRAETPEELRTFGYTEAFTALFMSAKTVWDVKQQAKEAKRLEEKERIAAKKAELKEWADKERRGVQE